jgi:hypothetical protein
MTEDEAEAWVLILACWNWFIEPLVYRWCISCLSVFLSFCLVSLGYPVTNCIISCLRYSQLFIANTLPMSRFIYTAERKFCAERLRTARELPSGYHNPRLRQDNNIAHLSRQPL